MKTIKVIDLLNKIASGEEIDKNIKIDDEKYSITDVNNLCLIIYEKTGEMCNDDELKLFLNKEVEIIEEKKIPEKIRDDNAIWEGQARDIDYDFKNTINQLIDYLKSKGDE